MSQQNERYEYLNTLVKRAQAGDGAALEELLTACDDLICGMARRYARQPLRSFTYEDLVQEARIALCDAAMRFRDGVFLAYARKIINSALTEALLGDPLIKQPRAIIRFRRAVNHLRARGECPTPEAVAGEIDGMSAECAQAIQVVEQARKLSLNAGDKERHERLIVGGLRPTEDLALDYIQADQLREAVAAALASDVLTETQREAVYMRYTGGEWRAKPWNRAKPKLRKLLAEWKPLDRTPAHRGVYRKRLQDRVRWEAWLIYSSGSRQMVKHYIGTFDSPRAAAEAVDDAAWAELGEKATLNFPARYAVD